MCLIIVFFNLAQKCYTPEVYFHSYKFFCGIDLIEFFLNVFTEFTELSDKNMCHYSKKASQPLLVLEMKINCKDTNTSKTFSCSVLFYCCTSEHPYNVFISLN